MSRAALFALITVAISACTRPDTSSLGQMMERVEASSDGAMRTDDPCVRVHNVWRDQLRVAATSAAGSHRERDQAYLDQVYRPHAQFWSGYVGDEASFRRSVARRWADLAADPRANIPLETDVEGLIRETSETAATLADHPVPCAEWYLIYGPGYTNMGGLASGGMLVDFFGFGTGVDAEELRVYAPHEIAHLLFGPRRDDPAAGTLLHVMLDEGFATYFSVVYSGGEVSPAAALGYSEAEWAWALEHEAEIWQAASSQLVSRERDAIFPFRAVRERILPGAPGKIGYFIGYRLIESYVGLHGEESWRDFLHLPLEEALVRSHYMSPSRPSRGAAGT